MSEPLRSPEGEHARRPGTARGLDLDGVADDGAEQRAAERGVGRDAADARDLDLQLVAGLVLDLDERADLDPAARGGRVLVDDDRVVEAAAQDRDPALEQALLVLGGGVLEVLGEVAELASGL